MALVVCGPLASVVQHYLDSLNLKSYNGKTLYVYFKHGRSEFYMKIACNHFEYKLFKLKMFQVETQDFQFECILKLLVYNFDTFFSLVNKIFIFKYYKYGQKLFDSWLLIIIFKHVKQKLRNCLYVAVKSQKKYIYFYVDVYR